MSNTETSLYTLKNIYTEYKNKIKNKKISKSNKSKITRDLPPQSSSKCDLAIYKKITNKVNKL